MGNCILNFNKDHFFAFEELIKNDILFSKGMTWLTLDTVTRGTYTGCHSITKFSEIMMLTPLQTGAW